MKSHPLAALILTASLLAAPAVMAQDINDVNDAPSPAAMMIDLFVVRPLSLVAVAAGTVAFVVQAPFALMLGESPLEPAEQLVVEPARFTFTRRLGAVGS